MKCVCFALVVASVGICFAQSGEIRTAGSTVAEAGAIGLVIASAPVTDPFGAGVVTGKPFTADVVAQTDENLADGNHITNKQSTTVARDNQGRTHREQLLPSAGGSEQGKTIFISDPVGQVMYVLGPDHIAHELPLPKLSSLSPATSMSSFAVAAPVGGRAQRFTVARSANGATVQGASQGGPQLQSFAVAGAGNEGSLLTKDEESKTEQLGTQDINGTQAVGTRTTVTIPAGQIGNQSPIVITDERWYSQDLQATVLLKHIDPRFGESSFQLTNIQRTEPPATMFQVPWDYTIEGAAR